MLRLASDVGGTFTDLVAYDDRDGSLRIAKTLTTPQDPAQGVLDGVARAGAAPAAAEVFLHGSTIVINALLERKGVPTALVTTAGFRDILEIGRGNRPDLYNLRFHSPRPFVPRRHRFEVAERTAADGSIVEPLDEAALSAIAEACRADGVRAVAVCFLNSYANPVHERRAAEVLGAALPGIAITLSTDLTREWREYERTNTAVLNAYVQPIVDGYLANLENGLGADGFAGRLFAMQSNGGTTGFATARKQPIALVESGPAGGINGAETVARHLGADKVLYLDIGGTTAKASLIVGGRATLSTDYKLERTRTFPGYPVRASILDVVEIGAGGGSIAWVDRGDVLRVGPRSAGADPGPACYARGGTDATLTDANIWTGRIGGAAFARNALSLSRERAGAALEAIGSPLGLDADATALAVIRLAEAAMIEALKLVSVQRGHDTRDFVLIASGGGGPVHASRIGRELGVREILIPQHPGIFCAWGMLASAPHQEFVRTALTPLHGIDADGIDAVFREMEEEAVGYFRAFLPNSRDRLDFERSCDMRYAGQEHTVQVELEGQHDPAAVAEAFHAAHARAYTFALDDTPPEVVSFRLLVRAEIDRPGLSDLAQVVAATPRTQGERPLLCDDGVTRDATIYRREDLPPDFALDGPAIVEEATSTTVVLPGQRLTVDDVGILHLANG